jgi:hypothetical protein
MHQGVHDNLCINWATQKEVLQLKMTQEQLQQTPAAKGSTHHHMNRLIIRISL